MPNTMTSPGPQGSSHSPTAIPTTPALDEHRASRRGFVAMLLLALPLLAGACGGAESPTGPGPGTGPIGGGTGTGGGGGGGGSGAGAQFVGTYHLSQINGNALSVPYAEHHLGQGTYGRQYVEEGRLILHANRTYTLYLKKALTIGGGPRVYAPIEETGSWSYTSSGMSGTVLLGPTGANGYTIEATPYTVTEQRYLDPFGNDTEQLIYVRE